MKTQTELKEGCLMIRPCWCVVDFDEKFIIVLVGKMWPNGETSTDNHIIPTTGFEASRKMWQAFNDWQFTACPYDIY